ncbi:MAG: hypothetical protein J6N49_05230 [Alphaproteobacteria bacterium]|nr:hypothetical protein [Alphaproteobacteria bacterium]
MKKNVFFCLLTAVLMIAAAGVLSSCDDKKSEMKVGAYTLFEQNGLLGLKDSIGQVVLLPKFTKIEENSEYNDAVIATTGPAGEATILVGGYPIIEGIVIDSIKHSDVPEYAFIYSKGGIHLWEVGKTSVTGPFTDIKITDDVIFLNSAGKWGAVTTQHHGLAPRKFDKLFIVKNGSMSAVVTYDKDGYVMYDKDGVSEGVRYDTSSKELERELKKLNVTGEIGVINVNWPL